MKTVGAGFPLAQDPHRNIQEIDVSVQGAALDYAAAHALADVLAKKVARDAMLVAWFDGKNDVGYPVVQECAGDKHSWLACDAEWPVCMTADKAAALKLERVGRSGAQKWGEQKCPTV